MTDSPSFTVVVPTFNRGASLLATLRTVQDQTWDDFEVVVVDDGSDDAPTPAVASLRDPRFRCVRQANAGPGAARNRGVAQGRGRWVTFLDDDDEVEPGWLATLAGRLAQGVAIVFCGVRYSNAADGQRPQDLGPAFGGCRGSFIPGTFAIDRALFLASGGYEPSLRFSENTELLLRVLDRCRRDGLAVDSVDDVLLRYHRPPGREDRIDSRHLLHAAEYLLEHHDERLRLQPVTLADYASVAGVQAARLGRYRESRRHLVRALRADPRTPARAGRVLVACVPPLARRAWGRAPEPERQDDGLIRVRASGDQTPVEAVLLHAFDPSALATWRRAPAETPLPYRVEEIGEAGVDLVLTDAMHRGVWANPMVRRCVVALERLAAPFLQPALLRREIGRRPITIAMFESHANAVALARLLRILPFRRPALVVISCWLARDIRRFGRGRRWLYRRTYRTVDRVVYFSSNQTGILATELGVPESKLSFVPFGIDTDFFRPAGTADGEPFVLAVGRERERDWTTFFAAVSALDVPVKVACRPELLEGVAVPGNVELLGMVPRTEYRELLRKAAVVVVSTHPVEYPSGQSVLLEALATGACCVATATPALADYLADDTVVSVPPADPDALRQAIEVLLNDPGRRAALGARARARAVEEFDARLMWARIADVSRLAAKSRHVDR